MTISAMNASKNSELIKKWAAELGFDFCGIAKAEFLEEQAPKLENWLNAQMHGKMSYMANHFDLRLDPTKLVPDAKSVISLMLNYFPEQDLAKNDSYKISKYAYGEDYHFVIKDKLRLLLERINTQIGQVSGRAFVDSAPVLERVWAQRSGMGWIGKNSLIINPKAGSFFFLAELIIDLELTADGAIKDYCGTCRRCIDACPTEAIVSPYVVDGSRCISYFTIELKEQIPDNVQNKFDNWIFGCDICQDVCPWNRFSRPHRTAAFAPHEALPQMNKNDWHELTEEVFRVIFKNTPVKRTKFEGLKRNIAFVRS